MLAQQARQRPPRGPRYRMLKLKPKLPRPRRPSHRSLRRQELLPRCRLVRSVVRRDAHAARHDVWRDAKLGSKVARRDVICGAAIEDLKNKIAIENGVPGL